MKYVWMGGGATLGVGRLDSVHAEPPPLKLVQHLVPCGCSPVRCITVMLRVFGKGV